ncbi:hypothetical protein ACIPVK_20750 [Paeniglutamicibacter sp. MACA_103]|uniref:hypothetical protein n=1 Tax=Paeniglutamicibacter sp. MACA_103 TaxID=3377337 RepID=UPI0038967B3D
MTGWAGTNWQFFDDEDTQTRIGVTFGLGLLDEEVAATGSLSMALAALRTELARPVELGAGRTGFPEVITELGADTSTLLLRGSTETVAAAWRRLPGLFAGWMVTDQIAPIRPEHPVWPADLVQRTGRNAAALAGVQVTASDVRERARALLPRLDPASGRTRTAFFTTDESLVGAGFPVQEGGSGPAPVLQWADGTAKRGPHPARAATGTLPEGPDALARRASGNGPGMLPVSEASIMLSTLVPRSAAGLAAAELLRAQLSATAAHAGQDPATIGLDMLGVGAEFCVFLLTKKPLGDAVRQRVLREFSRTMTLVPDPWVEDAVRETGQGLSPRLSRERRVLGLDDDPGADTGQVRQALIDATQSLHLALEPETHGPGTPGGRKHARPRGRGEKGAAGRGGNTGRERIFRTLPGGDLTTDGSATLAIGQGTLRLASRSAGHGGSTRHEQLIEAESILAVLVDPAGTLAIIDDDQQVLTFHPLLFRRHRALQPCLDRLLAGQPRLEINNDADPTAIRRRLGRAKRFPAWLLAGAAALGVYLIVAIAMANIDDPQVSERITIGETAQLGNGTSITATGFDRRPTAPDDPESEVAVMVRFCAGSDTRKGDLPPETQRSVSPADFGMYNDRLLAARPIDSGSQLRRDTLQQGQCAVGELVFKGAGLSTPRLAYKNPFGDDVVWYSPGQVPAKP